MLAFLGLDWAEVPEHFIWYFCLRELIYETGAINSKVKSLVQYEIELRSASFQTPVLFTLAEDLSKMELHVDVDEADVGRVETGQNATFTVDAYPDRRFPTML